MCVLVLCSFALVCVLSCAHVYACVRLYVLVCACVYLYALAVRKIYTSVSQYFLAMPLSQNRIGLYPLSPKVILYTTRYKHDLYNHVLKCKKVSIVFISDD